MRCPHVSGIRRNPILSIILSNLIVKIYNKNMHTKGFPQKALERLDQRESLKKVSKKMQ